MSNESSPKRLTVDEDWVHHPQTQELLKALRSEATIAMMQLHVISVGSDDPEVRSQGARISFIQEQIEAIEKGFIKNDEQTNNLP